MTNPFVFPILSLLFHGPLAQLARAPALQAGGRGFESHKVHHIKTPTSVGVFMCPSKLRNGAKGDYKRLYFLNEDYSLTLEGGMFFTTKGIVMGTKKMEKYHLIHYRWILIGCSVIAIFLYFLCDFENLVRRKKNTVCPESMIYLQDGDFFLGQDVSGFNATETLGGMGSWVFPQNQVSIQSFCIEKYPSHGILGGPWMKDGLSDSDLPGLEHELEERNTGRRFCKFSELLLVSSGKENFPFVYGAGFEYGKCDTNPDRPTRLIGSFDGCVGSLGVYDFGVRVSAVLIDDVLREKTGIKFRECDRYAWYGGNARWSPQGTTDAFHFNRNASVHWHYVRFQESCVDTARNFPSEMESSKHEDDDVRFCADPADSHVINSIQEKNWRELTREWVRRGEYGKF